MKKALKCLGFGAEGGYDKEIEKELFRSSWRLYIVIRTVLFVYEFVMLSMLCAKEGGPLLTKSRTLYFVLYLTFLIITMLFIVFDLLWDKSVAEKYKLYIDMGFVYAIVITLWACGVTLLDQMEGKGLTLYACVLLVTAALFMLKPWQSITLFGSCFIILNLLLPYFPPLHGIELTIDNSLDSLIITGIAIVMSIYFTGYRVRSYQNLKIIDKQFEKISEANERLSQEIIVDSLTGLYNRRYLGDTVHARFHDLVNDEKATPLTCLMLDVDFFKQYNDTYGHQKGDECLVKISEIIKQSLPTKHAKTVRYGGEEFAVFIFNCNKEQGLAFAEKLRSRVEKNHFERSDIPRGYITISIGAYTGIPSKEHHPEMRGFIHRADKALYEAKKSGRNCVKEYKDE